MTVSLDQLETTYCTIQGGDKTELGIMHSSENDNQLESRGTSSLSRSDHEISANKLKVKLSERSSDCVPPLKEEELSEKKRKREKDNKKKKSKSDHKSEKKDRKKEDKYDKKQKKYRSERSDKKEKKEKKDKKPKREETSSSSDDEDGSSSSDDDNTRRSVITGKKIKMSRENSIEDQLREADRAAKRHYMNSQF